MTTIGFLHTAEAHVATFRGLFAELAPAGLDDLHLVDEGLLADARRTGSAPGLTGRLRELAAAGADLIVCTCSTIGADAEADRDPGVPVLRLDRPMAEAAVATAAAAVGPTGLTGLTGLTGRAGLTGPAVATGRILVVATVESTLEPTVALIRATAEAAGARVTVDTAPCLAAWRHFEAGDIATYDRVIAEHVRTVAEDAGAIVLAQAGMAGAASLLSGLPVFTSPRTAVEAAVHHATTLPKH